ncbi:hypothetical protein ANN_03383 [Periplaneta americana]|uniref:Uncharacterized protein n=1 Tax=Periplaneta americana TaxID=6978 RepID=A0ABQ8U4A9_PERAM|nr:hypothetical protein ANN_03383 [Periplaneta americana]
MDFLENKLDTKIEQKIQQRLMRQSPEKTTLTEKMTNHVRDEENATSEENNKNYQDCQKETEWGRTRSEERTPQTIQQGPSTGSTEEECELEVADKMAWLYIGRLKPNITTNNVRKFLKRNGFKGNIECEKLSTRGERKAFKIGFPYSYLENTQKTDFWPQGIVVRRYHFRRKAEDTGVELQ